MFRHFDSVGRAGALAPAEVASIAARFGVQFI